jgi:hypothetical protein
VELGIKNYVAQSQDWDERGNKKAFRTVRIPTVDEERERAVSGQREQLMREPQRVAGMGRGLPALHNLSSLSRSQKLKRHRSVGEGSVKESYQTKNNLNLCTERCAPLFTLLWPKSQSFCVALPGLSRPLAVW